MAENFYRALWALVICVVVTVVVSLFTQAKTPAELKDVVFGYTEIPSEGDMPFYKRPWFWAIGVGLFFAILQWIFW